MDAIAGADMKKYIDQSAFKNESDSFKSALADFLITPLWLILRAVTARMSLYSHRRGPFRREASLAFYAFYLFVWAPFGPTYF